MFQELSYTFFTYLFSLDTHGKLMKSYWVSHFSVSENVETLIVYSYHRARAQWGLPNSEFLSWGREELPFPTRGFSTPRIQKGTERLRENLKDARVWVGTFSSTSVGRRLVGLRSELARARAAQGVVIPKKISSRARKVWKAVHVPGCQADWWERTGPGTWGRQRRLLAVAPEDLLSADLLRTIFLF